MKTLPALLSALVTLPALAAPPPIAEPAAVDAVIDQIVADGGYPFIHVRLEDGDGNVIYEHGARNSELVPMAIDGDSWIRIWSMSKPVTIAITLDLVEQGVLKLDDPVTKFIPEFTNLKVARGPNGEGLIGLEDSSGMCPYQLEPMTETMTVEHLLDHKGGFYYPYTGVPCLDETFGAADLPTAKDSQELIDRLAKLPLVLQPGEDAYYSAGTTVLGLVNERATGKTLTQLVKDHVTGPLGIEGLQYGQPEGTVLPPRISGADGTLRPAHGDELDIFGTQLPDYDPEHTLYLGGEGMLGTANGYADFARMLLHRGELNGHRLLDDATIDALTSRRTQLDNPYGHNGYNLWISNGLLSDGTYGPAPLWIGGGYEGTHFWIDPERGFVGVIMSQIFGIPEAGQNRDERIRMAIYEQMGVD